MNMGHRVEMRDFPTFEAAAARAKNNEYIYFEGGKFHIASPGLEPIHATPKSAVGESEAEPHPISSPIRGCSKKLAKNLRPGDVIIWRERTARILKVHPYYSNVGNYTNIEAEYLETGGRIEAGLLQDTIVYVVQANVASETAEVLYEASRGEVDQDALTELDLYLENTSELYAQKQAILRNLQKKIDKGQYDHALAPKLWLYWVDEGAKRYAKEFGGKWNEIFNKATREALAAQIATAEYNELLIQQGKGGMNEEATATKLPEKERARLEKKAYTLTQKDYRGKVDGKPAVLVLWHGVTTLFPISSMTDQHLLDYVSARDKDAGASASTSEAKEPAGSFATVPADSAEIKQARKLGVASSPKAVYAMLHKQLHKESQEVLLVIPVDLHGRPLSRPVEVARGQRDRVAVDNADVLRPVISTNAAGYILVHQHPSGKASPSKADRQLTDSLKKATKEALPSVTFIDHVVVGDGEYFSISENKLHKA